jgi:spermidine synthase
MRVWLATVGLVSMLAQVVLLRELNVAFFGSELIYVLAIGVWMLLTAAGARAGCLSPSPARVRALFLALGVSTSAALVLARISRPMLADVPGEFLPLPLQLGVMAVVLAPASLLLGLAFQWAARLYAASGRMVAAAYAIESAGGLAGGALATLVMGAGVPNLVLGMGASLATCLVALHPLGERPRWLAPVVAPMALLLLLAWIASPTLDARLTGLSHPTAVASRDTAYGRVTWTGSGGQISGFVNDALVFETDDTAVGELVHVAALQRPRLGRVLILGGGVEGSTAVVLQHAPAHVDVVEINGALIDLATEHLPLGADALAADPVQVTVTDPRAFLRQPGPAYDLILVGAAEPSSGLSNRYFTREMFARARARLAPHGVLALRLPADDNILGPHQRRRLASIHRALSDELADTVVLPGTSHLLLASPAPLTRDPEVLGERLRQRDVTTRLVSGPYLRYLYQNDRFAEIAAAVAASDAPANRDGRPVCYQHTLMIWLSKFYPALALLELDPARIPWSARAVATLAAVALLLILRRSPGVASAVRVGIAGFVGMALESAVILAYQSGRGALFGDLGLLLTAFMAGLTAGSAAVARMRAIPGRLGLALTLALALVGALVAVAVAVAEVSLPIASLLLAMVGAAVAGVFAHATRVARDQAASVAPLYAADLAGGAAASLLATLLLIPWVGLWGTATLGAALGLGASMLADR